MKEILNPTEVRDERQVKDVALALKDLLHDYDTVAYVLGLRQGRTVKNWVEEGSLPAGPHTEARLRVAEKLALTVNDKQRPWVSAAWLISCNPYLREHAPSELIQSLASGADDQQIAEHLQYAADQFAALEG